MKKWTVIILLIVSAELSAQKKDSVEKAISLLEKELHDLHSATSQKQDQLEKLKFLFIHSLINETGTPLRSSQKTTVIKHRAMVLSYNEHHEQSEWVMHVILPDIATGNVSRTNDFREDSLVATGTAVKSDYWYSGYDRGHLAPSADFRWSATALSESYFYSNMSPQKPELNRERWSQAEDLLRAYVIKHNSPLIVVTGPVLHDTLKQIGDNKVSVPALFYKAAFDPKTGNAIGLVMPNLECEYPVLSYLVPIDSIEKLTGLDFFSSVSKEKQNAFEALKNPDPWKTAKEEGNALPLDPEKLPKGKLNTIQAQYHIGEKVTVCGTVVSTKYAEKSGATFINLDRQFPDQVFTIAIWKQNRANFSYKPEEYLKGHVICVTGELKDNKGKPQVEINNESAIIIVEMDGDE
ncbi:MAG: DNA/RNA non-specific endonuclease [Bacteroidota bacterium]